MPREVDPDLKARIAEFRHDPVAKHDYYAERRYEGGLKRPRRMVV
jgi:hypothetical protein